VYLEVGLHHRLSRARAWVCHDAVAEESVDADGRWTCSVAGWMLDLYIQRHYFRPGPARKRSRQVAKKQTSNENYERGSCLLYRPPVERRKLMTETAANIFGRGETNSHRSHITPEFDRFYSEILIIILYMPPHTSHLLQSLEVGCFSPLKG